MNWPSSTQPDALFPSFKGDEGGAVPQFPAEEPAWRILDPAHPEGIKSQMKALTGTIACKNPGFFTSGEGIIIDATATVEAGAYIIGPCYIGPEAVVRSGAYVREFSWICAGAVVGHSTETKHSVLLPGAKAPHISNANL